MFKNVLVGVDGRQGGRDAIALACRLTNPDAKLTLAHVHVDVLSPSHAITPGLLEDANNEMKALPDVEGHAVYGLTAEELASFSDNLDILIVGSRGYGPIRRLLLGSTSTFLARHGRCPLLLLPRQPSSQGADSSSELEADTPARAAA